MQGLEIELLVITCGTNDIDEKSGREVADSLIETAKRIKREHPQTKLVRNKKTAKQKAESIKK